MNVRDFLFNFVDSGAKICIEKIVVEKVLFYGKARELNNIDLLNQIVFGIEYDNHADCLTILLDYNLAGSICHLPEGLDHVY